MKTTLTTIIISILANAISSASVIANYDFSNSGSVVDIPDSLAEPLTSDTNVTASSFSTGSGFDGRVVVAPGITSGSDNLGNTGYGTGNGFLFANRGSGVNTNGTQAQAFSQNEFFEVSIAPDPNHQINYTSLSFFAWVNNKNRGADQFAVTSSIDGHSIIEILGSGEISPNSVGVTASNALAYDIDLSGAQFQNTTSATTFRIYVWDGGSNTSSSLVGLDNLVFDGTVTAIPEPSLPSLLIISLGSLAIRRRRS